MPFGSGFYLACVGLVASSAGGPGPCLPPPRASPADSCLCSGARPSAGRSQIKTGKKKNKIKNYNLRATAPEICMKCIMSSFCVLPSFSQPVLQNKLEGCLVFQEGGWEKA